MTASEAVSHESFRKTTNWSGFFSRNLPPQLAGLYELAIDLRWSWNHGADALWGFADRQLWNATQNPWLILQSLPQARIDELAATPGFVEQVGQQVAARAEYLARSTWFSEHHANAGIRPVAYFSMEFGLSEALPIYSGGLGILAGDHLKTASDLGVPLIGIGLLYQQGYFRQAIDAEGNQRELYPYNEPAMLPVTPVSDGQGGWLRIEIRMPGRPLRLRVWKVTVGRISLYLLDSNDPLNTPGDRGITAELYGGGTEMRLQQDIVLGMGGWRLVERLNPACQVCHLNEGHGAFAVLERARSFMMRSGRTFEVALRATRAGNIFTTHTPVSAGFDRFAPELLAIYVSAYAARLGISPKLLLGLGRANPDDDLEPFGMAYLAMRGSRWINGVSRLHGEVSKRIFAPLFPRWPEREVPVGHVTNGVHMPTWDSAGADSFWTAACGKARWVGTLDNMDEKLRSTEDETLWQFRERERDQLVRKLRIRLQRQTAAEGGDPAAIAACAQKLDPSALTIGFARRFTGYKRPTLMLRDIERLSRLLTNPRYPVQLVVAGKAHPRDLEGKRMVREWMEFTRRPEIAARAVFIEDYNMAIAAELVQGVDLWVNNPLRPWEACGTSGMKVLVNGGLNFSELDGWWAEAYAPEYGWKIGDGSEHAQDPEWDRAEAGAFYHTLETEVLPAFYDRDQRGIPAAWIARIRNSMRNLAPRFSSNRMLREYTERYYLPGAAASDRRTAEQGALAVDLETWARSLDQGWSSLSLGPLHSKPRDGGIEISVQVLLGEIDANSIQVELYAEPNGMEGQVYPMRYVGDADGRGHATFSAIIPGSRPVGDFTPRIVPAHAEAAIPLEDQHILWGA
ncbi:MAG: alpha-glucan family phosphorylase [Candidatus Binataceae bacterium]|nr:alpha-glucan family phosphorylase [Candidatus Binataceae bacterium]